MDSNDNSADSGWRSVGTGGSTSATRVQPQQRNWQQSRSGHATPWSGYATPQSGYASPRSAYASPRIAPQRGRALPPSSALPPPRMTPSAPRERQARSKPIGEAQRQAASISRSSTPGLKPSSRHVPTDITIEILRHYARISPTCALNALLISKSLSPALEDAAYSSVSLFSASAMNSFNDLVKARPEVGRRVKALWIAPGHLKSDLIPCLAPPTSNATNDARQRKVQGLARDILRACRRLDHLALDGGFLTPQSAVAFGTACKPRTLLCVNPHSFLGHFSAPIFRSTVRRLEIVDTTLAVEEVDEIRQMQGLHAFVWTSPRANTDVTRDVSVLLRILSPRAADIAAAARDEHVITDQALVDALTVAGNAVPDRARQNDKLKSICTSTSHARAAALAATFKKVVEDITLRDSEDGSPTSGEDDDDDEVDDIVRAMRAVRAGGGVYVDSRMSKSSALHVPSGVELQTEALSSLMQALAVATNKPKPVPDIRGAVNRVDAEAGADDESDVDQGDDFADDSDESDNDDDEVVEEWEALRDVVCQRRTANSTSRFLAGVGSSSTNHMSNSGLITRSTAASVRSGAPSTTASGISTPALGWGSQAVSAAVSRVPSRAASPSVASLATDEIDGGRALQRIWRRWRTQVNTGALERFVC